MPFNKDYLYEPLGFDAIEVMFLNEYNAYFNTNYTIQSFRYSNIYFVFFIAMQIFTELETIHASDFDNVVNYLKTRNDLEYKPKGTTLVGLESALKELTFIKAFMIAEPNNFSNNINPGQIAVIVDYDRNESNDTALATTLLNNKGVGIETKGDVIINTVSPLTNNSIPMSWFLSNKQLLHIRLFVKQSSNFYGEKLTISKIQDIYYNLFINTYKLGNDVEPAKLNSLNHYVSLAYINSQFSLDNINWLPLNAILTPEFKTQITIDKTHIEIINET